MPSSIQKEPTTLAIALGANLPSPVGSPTKTLIKVRPELEAVIQDWLTDSLAENNGIEKSIKNCDGDGPHYLRLMR